MTNPFHAKPKPSPAATSSPEAASSGPEVSGTSRAELKALTVVELRKLAHDRGLDTDGPKAELVERLLA